MRPRLTLLALAATLSLAGCRGRTPAPAPPAPTVAAPASTEAPAPAASAPAPAAQTFTVPDLPDYPGATRSKLETAEGKEGWARKVEAKFRTADPFDTVRAFYEKAIEANGWQVDGTSVKTEKGTGKVKWTLSKGTSAAEVKVESEKEGGVEIELERKDR